MGFISRGLWGLFLGFLTIGMIVLALSEFARVRNAEDDRGRSDPSGGAREISVSVQKAQATTESPVFVTFGEVLSSRQLQIRSPESGRVVRLNANFKNGALVQQGEVLAQINPAPLRASRDLTFSEWQDAQTNVVDAKNTVGLSEEELRAAEQQMVLQQAALDRQIELRDRGVGTDAALENAELSASSAQQSVLTKRQQLFSAQTSLARAEAAVTRAKISFEEAERKLADATITAPFSGALADISITEGVLVSPNEQIGNLIDPSALEVTVLLTLNRFSEIVSRTGDLSDLEVVVQLTDGGPAYPAIVTRSDATVSDGLTGRRIYASLDSTAAELMKSGDFVRVTLTEPAIENVFWMPAAGLGPDSDVLIVDGQNVLRAQEVKIVSRFRDRILVSAQGLNGALVVQELTPVLGEGVVVRPTINGQSIEPDAMIELSDDQRVKFTEFVNANDRMSQSAKDQILKQIEAGKMPQDMFNRLNGQVSQQG
ncbi:MAG: hypothetical protein AAF198_10465 [Pseudomonadota bacterium]